jgi:hypothetical protein
VALHVTRLLAVCHDAGGAEIVSSWLLRERRPFACVLEGPAVAVFARKLGAAAARHDAFPPLGAFDLVLCGSSGTADLERRAVRAARAAGVRSAVWLDHWVAYRERFVLAGELVMPDEVWVADAHAAELAAAALPDADVRLKGNPYLEDAAAEVRALAGEREPGAEGERILYVTEPTAVAAERETGDPLGWGYEEHDALARYLEHVARAASRPAELRIRLHPSEPRDKYAAELARFGGELPLSLSAGTALAEDCAWADTVVGCETMAMVVALYAGRRVVSVTPPGGRALSLPFTGIERLHAA